MLKNDSSKVKAHDQAVNLTCDFYGNPLSNFSWSKNNDSDNFERLRNLTSWTQVNETHVKLTLSFKSPARQDNGTYICSVQDFYGVVTAERHLYVIDVPLVNIEFVKAVGADSIFLNWTVNNGNEPIQSYFIQYMKNGSGNWQYYSELINGGNTSYVLKGFDKETAYQIGILAMNKVGKSNHVHVYPSWITTLKKGLLIF